MLQSLRGTKTKRTGKQLRIYNRNKLKNVSSNWKNIPSNLPKEVLQNKLGFQIPKTLPIWWGKGRRAREGARGCNFMGWFHREMARRRRGPNPMVRGWGIRDVDREDSISWWRVKKKVDKRIIPALYRERDEAWNREVREGGEIWI